MTWHGPTDEWPSHPDQVWRDALNAARDAGWHLCRFTGKNWGRVCCRRDLDACCVLIYTTGRATESVARDLPKKIRRCPHRSPETSDARRLLVRAGDRLGDAHSIMDAVEVIAIACEAADRAAELFDAVDAAVADAEKLAEQALSQAVSADQARAAGEDTLRALLSDAAVTPGGALDVVAERIGDVEADVAEVPDGGALLRALHERIAGARTRMSGLRRRLDA